MPPSPAGKPRGRSGEGIASLLAQLTRDRRVDDMLGAERPVDGPAEKEPASGIRDGNPAP